MKNSSFAQIHVVTRRRRLPCENLGDGLETALFEIRQIRRERRVWAAVETVRENTVQLATLFLAL